MTIKSTKDTTVYIDGAQLPPAHLAYEDVELRVAAAYSNQPKDSNGTPFCMYCRKLCDTQHFTEEGIYCSVRCHTLDTRV